ncbi:MAG: HU family DNA-binding protein [Desulfobacterales bacterium]
MAQDDVSKRDLIKSIQHETDHPEIEAAQIVNTIISEIKRSLESGEDVLISGFGKFQVKAKNARIGRNPANGNSMKLKARKWLPSNALAS